MVKNLVLSFITLSFLVLSFIGIEACLRIYKNTRGLNIHPDDKIVRDIVFNDREFLQSRKNKDKSFRSYYVNTNEEGFRSPPFHKGKNTSIRIAALGGSTMWGYNVSDDHTIPTFLKDQFKRHGIHVDIFNLGLNSSTLSQQMKYLAKYFDQIEPDIIINYCGANEFFDGTEVSETTLLQQFLSKIENYYTFKLILALGGLTRKNSLTPEEKLKTEKTVLSFQHAHGLYENFCFQRKLKCFTFFQPLIYNKNQKTFYENIIALAALYKNRHGSLYNYFIDRILQQLSNKKSPNKIKDIRNVFLDNNESLYTDDVHVNYIGNKILAKRIYDEIQNN